MKRGENPHLADRRYKVMPVHVGSEIRTDTCEDDVDPSVRQLLKQIAYGLRGRVVYIGDRARIDDEPADPRGRAIDVARTR